ncbi:hypothetical protein KAH94_06220 [bacterium]|nr:hypothetical protein [bacterium]
MSKKGYNRRFINLTPKQAKNPFDLNPKDFTNEKERRRFKYFNIANCYYLTEEKTFPSYEILQKFVENNPAYKDVEVKHSFALIMCE